MKNHSTALSIAALCLSVVSLVVCFGPRPTQPGEAVVPAPPDNQKSYRLSQNQQINQIIIEEVEEYGLDIYLMFVDSTLNRSQPGEFFGEDKAFRKMQVTFPNARLTKMAEATQVLNAIPRNDLLRVEAYLDNLDFQSPDRHVLAANGGKAVPSLMAFMFQYHLRRKNFAKAEELLQRLEQYYAEDLISAPGNADQTTISVQEYVAFHRELMQKGTRKP